MFLLYFSTTDGRVYALPLSMLEQDRQVPFCRRDCSQYHLRKSKGLFCSISDNSLCVNQEPGGAERVVQFRSNFFCFREPG